MLARTATMHDDTAAGLFAIVVWLYTATERGEHGWLAAYVRPGSCCTGRLDLYTVGESSMFSVHEIFDICRTYSRGCFLLLSFHLLYILCCTVHFNRIKYVFRHPRDTARIRVHHLCAFPAIIRALAS